MSRVYVCQSCGNTVSKFFLHICPNEGKEPAPIVPVLRTRAADDAEVIARRLEELKKEREEARNYQEEEKNKQAPTPTTLAEYADYSCED